MKQTLFLSIFILSCATSFSQGPKKDAKNDLLKEMSQGVCLCIDSISVEDKVKGEITKEINICIDNAAGAYQLGAKMADADSVQKSGNSKKQINLTYNTDKNSDEYKRYYYELERYLMANCESVKDKVATNDKQSAKSFSNNEEALAAYSKGLTQSSNKNYRDAISYFKKAVKIDPEFAFAWDNMGICHRMLNQYDEAIAAYSKSLEVDPQGLMPLQNIAVVYQYKKEYDKAINAYLRLAEVDPKNPEVFYGIGNVYAMDLNQYEKGLENICKAYNLYVAQNSPYRTDAEKLIQIIYTEMKKEGKEDKFKEILKANKISTD